MEIISPGLADQFHRLEDGSPETMEDYWQRMSEMTVDEHWKETYEMFFLAPVTVYDVLNNELRYELLSRLYAADRDRLLQAVLVLSEENDLAALGILVHEQMFNLEYPVADKMLADHLGPKE